MENEPKLMGRPSKFGGEESKTFTYRGPCGLERRLQNAVDDLNERGIKTSKTDLT